MKRTQWRPLPQGELSALQTLVFAGALGGAGLWLLVQFVNTFPSRVTVARASVQMTSSRRSGPVAVSPRMSASIRGGVMELR
jgi:hypothetical protein